MSLAMTPAEREAFLADLHVGVIAIAEPERGPMAVPIWYSYEPGGDVVVLMDGTSRKMRAIDAVGRFSLVAQTERPPYQYVSVEGPVSSVESYDGDEMLAMAVRYLGEDFGRAYAADGPGENSVKVTMTPERWFTTDYNKR